MDLHPSQGDLFEDSKILYETSLSQKDLPISKETLKSWQIRVSSYQAKFFANHHENEQQKSFFSNTSKENINTLIPLKLTPLPLNFWRWPKSPYKGSAIYLVIDFPEHLRSNILLYIGETNSADKRWKGEHDCKRYLEAYSESLHKVGLKKTLSIRFWSDVPKSSKKRKELEQSLIQRWLPPFNKETRNRWQTPFTS